MTKSFNTVEYINEAIEAGFSRKQAEFQATVMDRLITDELATKSFLHSELEKFEYRLLVKLGSLMLAGLTVLGFVMKF